MEQIDPARLGEMLISLIATCRAFGWDYPTAALDYAAPSGAEGELLRDFLTISRVGDPVRRTEAWARLDSFIDDNDLLDRIAAAIV